jgi:hypothetical protein
MNSGHCPTSHENRGFLSRARTRACSFTHVLVGQVYQVGQWADRASEFPVYLLGTR